jgi:hypothetical protein
MLDGTLAGLRASSKAVRPDAHQDKSSCPPAAARGGESLRFMCTLILSSLNDEWSDTRCCF